MTDKKVKYDNPLSKKDILDAKDLNLEPIEVPEWKGTVFMRGISGDERDVFETRCVKARGNGTFNAARLKVSLLVLSLYDEEGKRLFAEVDLVALNLKSGAVIDRLFGVAQELSCLDKKTVDKITENSEAAPSGVSG